MAVLLCQVVPAACCGPKSRTGLLQLDLGPFLAPEDTMLSAINNKRHRTQGDSDSIEPAGCGPGLCVRDASYHSAAPRLPRWQTSPCRGCRQICCRWVSSLWLAPAVDTCKNTSFIVTVLPFTSRSLLATKQAITSVRLWVGLRKRIRSRRVSGTYMSLLGRRGQEAGSS